jgi:uncharacterized membrane protein (DUF4010 family)
MFLRILIVATVIDPALFADLVVPLCAGALAAGAIGLVLANWSFSPGSEEASPDLTNPFDLRLVLRFAALLGVVMLLAAVLRAQFGADSAIWLAAAAGLADVDAVTLSMARHAGGEIPVQTAILAILVVGYVNSASKAVMAALTGSREFALRFALAMAVAVIVSATVYWISAAYHPGAVPA